jgi:hypothetical protein
MTRPHRPTIAGLMAFILCVALGLAALRNAGPYLATALYNLTFFSLPTAIVCAVVGRRMLRGLATGYAAFGSAYFLFNLLPLRPYSSFGYVQGRPTLLIEKGFVLLQPYLKPMPPSDMQGFIDYDLVSQSLAIILCGIVGAALSRFVAWMYGRRRPNAGEDDNRAPESLG